MGQVARLMEEKNELAREVIRLNEELRVCRAWLGYESWKSYHYTYDDFERVYYKGGQEHSVRPFTSALTEDDLRKEYSKLHKL